MVGSGTPHYLFIFDEVANNMVQRIGRRQPAVRLLDGQPALGV